MSKNLKKDILYVKKLLIKKKILIILNKLNKLVMKI